MTQYSFVTTWRIGAPIDRVWEAIHEIGRWPEWWRYVKRATELTPGDDRGVGSIWRLEWRTALPYSLTFDSRTTRVDPPHNLDAEATGELRGTGRWSLTRQGTEGRETLVRYDWNVGTDKVWMNALAPVARPLFEWNHHVLMAEGGRALARHLGAELLEARPHPPSALAALGGRAAAAAGVLGILGMLAFLSARRARR
ncbi:MAG TPA: SRPBCC family protein [Chloroflexota bacterium]